MATISIGLAVLSTLFFAWLGYKYQEGASERFLTGAKKGGEVKVSFASDFGPLLIVMLTMVFLAIGIALTLTL